MSRKSLAYWDWVPPDNLGAPGSSPVELIGVTLLASQSIIPRDQWRN